MQKAEQPKQCTANANIEEETRAEREMGWVGDAQCTLHSQVEVTGVLGRRKREWWLTIITTAMNINNNTSICF